VKGDTELDRDLEDLGRDAYLFRLALSKGDRSRAELALSRIQDHERKIEVTLRSLELDLAALPRKPSRHA
jgi:hypothetical protein